MRHLAKLLSACLLWVVQPFIQTHADQLTLTLSLGDPDTIPVHNSSYYATYATSATVTDCVTRSPRYMRVPVIYHGSGERAAFGSADCAHEAMGGALPDYIEDNTDIWAPTVVHYNGLYRMYYTYQRDDTFQRCIGYAESAGLTGFRNHRDWACPPNGRWALDADAFVWNRGPGFNNGLYVTYRDDYPAPKDNESAISVVQANEHGYAFWSTRRTLLRSEWDVTWDWISGNQQNVIENPSMMYFSRGGMSGWYLFFSGNDWNSADYATGIAFCGATPIPNQRCQPVWPSTHHPYFGYSARTPPHPLKRLPGNHPGPGGMSLFRTHGGQPRAVWHWRDIINPWWTRYLMNGSVHILQSDATFTIK